MSRKWTRCFDDVTSLFRDRIGYNVSLTRTRDMSANKVKRKEIRVYPIHTMIVLHLLFTNSCCNAVRACCDTCHVKQAQITNALQTIQIPPWTISLLLKPPRRCLYVVCFVAYSYFKVFWYTGSHLPDNTPPIEPKTLPLETHTDHCSFHPRLFSLL